ncbi:solute carrier family 25 member 43-like [Antedon mediterranea]|uniref:solute carrier family 25 member 43-like n=1 Tax=Antedon mediterranea TaxID=105859 RepID=UPI003AF43DE0
MGRAGRDDRLTDFQNFSCGAVAGIVSRTVVSPLDVIKILTQVGTTDTRNGFLNSFMNVYKSQGLRAFWKGNLIGCLRLSPFSAIQFSSYYKFKHLFADQHGRLAPYSSMAAGTLGGVVASILTYPTDMVKTRLIVQHTQKPRYSGIIHAFALIVKEEGVLALYKGMFVSICGALPFTACTFVTYEFLDQFSDKPRYMLTPMQNFCNGCVAAAFAQTVSFPFDTIRKKLQAQSSVMRNGGGVDVHFRGMISAFSKTIELYGYKGLWRGNLANICKVVPYAGLMFMSFEACKRGFLHQNGYTKGYWDDAPVAGVDQSLKPNQLREWNAHHR